MKNELARIRSLLEDIEGNQTDSLTKSRYVTDGTFAMYVILLPAPDGGGCVITANCNMDSWADNREEYMPDDIRVEGYQDYQNALNEYWRWDL